ncbi:MAG: DNA polymerase domain-containing protein, partial [Thermoplasmata archaeon]
TYKAEGNETIVELFGRTDDRRSITIRVFGFRPYFHVVTPPAELRAYLQGHQDVVGLEDTTLFVDGAERSCLKVYTRFPFNVPALRNECQKRCIVLAADILFVYRFIYDLDLGSTIKVSGTRAVPEVAARYTTALVIETDTKSLSLAEPFQPDLTVFSFDIENSIQTRQIFCICCAIRTGRKEDIQYIRLRGDEKKILTEFVELFWDWDPDVITGYNIDNYDIPLVIERLKANKLPPLRWGRNYSEPDYDSNDRSWKSTGRVVADAWWNAKREIKPKKETLNAISMLLLGERKEDVDPKQIDREWAQNPEKVLSYCQKDAELALKILEKLEVVHKYLDLAAVSKLPLDDVLNGRTSTLIDSILIREADRRRIGVPLTKRNLKERQIEGGYVHSVKPGLYDMVLVLDFKSMYPSVMIANNICFTTLSSEGTIVAPPPAKAKFLSPEVRKGLIPEILKNLMEDRDRAKKAMAASRTPEEKAYFNGLQNAVKILMNSFYGVMASSFYRFTNIEIGESITAFARDNIKNIIQTLTDEGYLVLYSDTDSIFVKSPGATLEEAVALGKQLAERFSKDGKSLEFEKVLSPFFSHGKKKRYVGQIVWPHNELLVRGYETRRTDSFDLQSQSLNEVFELMMKKDIEGALAYARKVIKDTKEGKVPIESLVISRTAQTEKVYKDPESQAHVVAAKKLREMGYDFVEGMKVSYIVIDGRSVPQKVEPYIDGRSFPYKPDFNYYARRLAMSLSRITEVYGWNEDSLMSGVRQQSLFRGSEQDEDELDDDNDMDTISGDTGLVAEKKSVDLAAVGTLPDKGMTVSSKDSVSVLTLSPEALSESAKDNHETLNTSFKRKGDLSPTKSEEQRSNKEAQVLSPQAEKSLQEKGSGEITNTNVKNSDSSSDKAGVSGDDVKRHVSSSSIKNQQNRKNSKGSKEKKTTVRIDDFF